MKAESPLLLLPHSPVPGEAPTSRDPEPRMRDSREVPGLTAF